MRPRLAGAGTVVLVAAVLPFVLSGAHTARLATAGSYVIAILGLDILLRHTGRVSLAQGAFMGIGAYTAAILVADHGVRDVLAIPIAAGVAGAVGILLALVTVRVSTAALALATFGAAIVFPTLPAKFDGLTGGSRGLTFIGSPHLTGRGGGALGLTQAQWIYFLTWAIAAALVAAAWAVLSSRAGRSFAALREGGRAATSAGINRLGYSTAAFAAAAALAGVAGSLVALDDAHVDPARFPLSLSLLLVVGAAAGVVGSIWGALLGGVLVEFLPDVVGGLPRVASGRAGPSTFAFGAILVVLVLARRLLRRG